MRNLELDWDESYDYGPNEMAELRTSNPKEYNKIMSQNIGSQSEIETFYERNRKQAEEYLYQQRRK